MNISVWGLTIGDWQSYLEASQTPQTVLSYLLDGLYKDRSIWDRHISPKLHEKFANEFNFYLPAISRLESSDDKTTKFQIRMSDGLEVETVLIPFHKRYTVCLSTQVGCAMNCSFCFTGTQGLKRHLSTEEIVGQYLVVSEWLKQINPHALKPSIVLMGQGEPLHNCEAVKKAIEILSDSRMIGIGPRKITLSTVGYLPSLKELKTFPRINLALSLHSPFDEERNKLIPLNQRWPLREVLAALDEVPLLRKQFIAYEYLLIKDFNMSENHALELSNLLAHRKAIINLIPFNPFPGSKWQRPSMEEVEAFKSKLVKLNLRTMVRSTKGDDILAACGQLKIKEMARNYDQ